MILSNQVKCLKCEHSPFSATVHDFKTCKCGNISVDGGSSYLRRVGGEEGYEDLSILMDNDIIKRCNLILQGVDTHRDSEVSSAELVALTIGVLRNQDPYRQLANESAYTAQVKDACVAEVNAVRERLGGANALGILCAIARTLRDNGMNEMMTNPENYGRSNPNGYKVGEKHSSAKLIL